MSTSEFQITSTNSSGEIIQMWVQATSSRDALRLSKTNERHVISIRRRGFQWTFRRTSGLTSAIQLAFCESLLQLLQSGFNLNESLEILTRQPNGVTQRISNALLARLYVGESPATAFANTNLQWPELLISLLRAGETNGELGQCLARFCELERKSLAVRKKLVSASVYPMAMLFFSAVVMTFLLVFVVPKFATLVDDPNRSLPFASRLVFGVSQQLANHGVLIAVCLITLLFFLISTLRSARLRPLISRTAQRLPMIGPLLLLIERSRLNRVISALVNGSMPISLAIEKATSGSSPRSSTQLREARELILQGETPSSALFKKELINDIESQLLRSAERGGQLGPMLERIALIQEDAISAKVDRLAAFYSPLLLFVVALIVGVVVIALYWPLLDVFESVR